MPIKVFEWNINQATNVKGSNEIPSFVTDEILKMDKDIFILTEFAWTKNADDVLSALSGVYDYRATEYRKYNQNEVLIGWRKDRFSLVSDDKIDASNDNPDLLSVDLNDNESGKTLTVVGCRIKVVEPYSRRCSQFETIVDFTNAENVLVGGDFNCLREDYKGQDWGLGVMKRIAESKGYELHTPNGNESSIYQKNNYIVFKEDHFLTRGIKCNDVSYSREFTKQNPDIYLHGEDFSVYNRNVRAITWSIPFGSGIPDHAMVVGEFKIGEEIYDDIGQE